MATLDPRRILIFRAVARAGSISAAARELGWTQPAVTQHLNALERSVGCALLLRGPAGVGLTEPGTALLERADAMAAQLDLAHAELAALTGLASGHVRLAAYPSAAAGLVPRVIRNLQDSAPGVSVSLVDAEPPDAFALLAAGEVDVALVFGYDSHDPVGGPTGLTARQLGMESLLLVTPTGAAGSQLQEFWDADWVVGCRRCRGHVVERCRAVGFEPRIRHETDDQVVAQSLVAAGLGVAILPASGLGAFRHPGVQTHEDPSLGRRHLGCAYRDGADRVPGIGALLDELTRVSRVSPEPPG